MNARATREGGRIDGVPMPQDGEALNIEHRELPLVDREGVAGEGGDAEAGEDGLLDGFVAAEFQARVKGDAVEMRRCEIAARAPLLRLQASLGKTYHRQKHILQIENIDCY